MSEPAFDPLEGLRVLQGHGVRFVLIGGYAAAIRGSPVITGDLDVCYARDDENLGRLAAALRDLGARLRGAPPDVPFRLDEETLRRGDAFTFSTRVGPIDCIGTPAGTDGYGDLRREATDEDLDGLTVAVAGLDDLIRMKRAGGRPKDRVALEWLGALRDELEGEDEASAFAVSRPADGAGAAPSRGPARGGRGGAPGPPARARPGARSRGPTRRSRPPTRGRSWPPAPRRRPR